MGKYSSLGNLKLIYLPACNSLAAPTLAEIAAGTPLQQILERNGLKTPFKGKTIPTGAVDDPYNTTIPGEYGGEPIHGKFFRDSVNGSDVAWTTLVRGLTGFWLIARYGGSGSPAYSAGLRAQNALAAGDKCEVWPIQVITPSPEDISSSTSTMITVECAVPSSPQLYATVT